MSNAKTVMSQAANTWAGPTYIEDVFSTYLYTGNGSTQTITNGIDLAGEGGMVWIKNRSAAANHFLFDTERGATNYVLSNSTIAQTTNSTTLTSFGSDSFSLGASSFVNSSGLNFASWTWRKAPRWFDVVTYTGDGVSGRTISHNLGVAPGCVIVKRTDSTRGWGVYHRSIGATNYLVLESTQAAAASTGLWNDTEPTDSVFTVGNNLYTNGAGATYVAYLFAHDPLGPSGDGSDGLIACGSFTTDGSGLFNVDLGWEPQWILAKRSDSTGDWSMLDNMRGITDSSVARVWANLANAEGVLSGNYIKLTPTGFKGEANYFGTNGQVIYIAIRRGPMRQPTSGTEVFSSISATASSGTIRTVGFPMDLNISRPKAASSTWIWQDRMRGFGNTNAAGQTKTLNSDDTDSEGSNTTLPDVYEVWNTTRRDGGFSSGNSSIWYHLRRAPGFFDVVAYEGDGLSTSTFNHNLGVAPELMIIKNRDDIRDWCVYHKDLGATYLMNLNSSSAAYQSGQYFPADPTETVFRPGSASATNRSGYSHIAYLFATLPGVSKVGSYTGNGSSQTINCGFTSGARFVLIKRTDSTGDWYVWDTKQGIVAGNDPRLKLNDPGSQITTDDSIDPDNSGFIVNQVAATDINVSSASYIYLAIA